MKNKIAHTNLNGSNNASDAIVANVANVASIASVTAATNHASSAAAANSPAPDSAPLPINALFLDNQLCFALYSASLAMTKTYRPLLAELDLTYPQYIVLLALWERDAQTVSQLGERLNLDSGTLTPLLKRMEIADFLVRRRASSDERVVQVFLRPKAIGLQTQALGLHQKVACRLGMPLPEAYALLAQLSQLKGSLCSPLISDVSVA